MEDKNSKLFGLHQRKTRTQRDGINSEYQTPHSGKTNKYPKLLPTNMSVPKFQNPKNLLVLSAISIQAEKDRIKRLTFFD